MTFRSKAETTEDPKCHLCRRTLPANSIARHGLFWCRNTVDCNERARRRLGMPIHACVEAKARDLERMAQREHDRAALLASLPYKDRNAAYLAVINSPDWKQFANDQREMAGSRCEGFECGHLFRELEVHHLSYRRLGNELPQDVLVLCATCHQELDEKRRDRINLDRSVDIAVAGMPPKRVVRWLASYKDHADDPDDYPF